MEDLVFDMRRNSSPCDKSKEKEGREDCRFCKKKKKSCTIVAILLKKSFIPLKNIFYNTGF
jgi:hypothetical protein